MSNCSCERWLQCITCSIPRGSFNLTKNKNQPLNCQRRINTPPPWAIRIVFISFSIGSIGSVLDIILQAFLLLFQKPCRIIFYLCLLISTCVYLCLSISPRATSIWLYNKFHRHLQTSSRSYATSTEISDFRNYRVSYPAYPFNHIRPLRNLIIQPRHNATRYNHLIFCSFAETTFAVPPNSTHNLILGLFRKHLEPPPHGRILSKSYNIPHRLRVCLSIAVYSS